MMPYDEFGRPVERRRTRYRERTMTPWQTVVAAIVLVTITIVVAWWCTKRPKANDTAKRGPTHDSMCVTYTYDGQMIRYYVMTDPDTQRQYIVNDRGGMCLREPYETRDEGMRSIRHDDGTVEYISNDSSERQGTSE